MLLHTGRIVCEESHYWLSLERHWFYSALPAPPDQSDVAFSFWTPKMNCLLNEKYTTLLLEKLYLNMKQKHPPSYKGPEMFVQRQCNTTTRHTDTHAQTTLAFPASPYLSFPKCFRNFSRWPQLKVLGSLIINCILDFCFQGSLLLFSGW